MAFLGIGRKDRDGRQVRIEHRGKHLRASRTGGVALREQIEAGGLTLTANSQRGTRVSLTPARKTQVAFQNSRFILRGRYGKGPARVNLSKSGLSLSSRMGLGTINLTHPGRSSAKLGGVQIRGRKAAAVNAVAALVQMVFVLLRVAIIVLGHLVVAVSNLTILGYDKGREVIAKWRHRRLEKRRRQRTGRLEAAARQWRAGNGTRLEGLTPEECLDGLASLLRQAGEAPASDDGAELTVLTESLEDGADDKRRLLHRLSLIDVEAGPATLPVGGVAVLAARYRELTDERARLDAFFRLDERTLEHGPRTVGQEQLLEDIADLFGLRLEAAADDRDRNPAQA